MFAYTDVFYPALNFPFRLLITAGDLFFYLEVLTFLLGSYFLFFKLTSCSKLAIVQVSTAFIILFASIGFDFVSWRSCLFPALVLSCISFNWTLPIVTVLWCLTSGTLSLFGLLISIVLAVFAFERRLDFYLLFSLFICLVLRFPEGALPDYPGDAFLVPLSAIKTDRTIFAPEHFFKFINQENFILSLKKSILLFNLLFLLWFIVFRPKDLFKNKYLLISLLLIFLIPLGELTNYQLMPYRFIYRFIPGVALLPFVWDLFLILTITLITLCLKFCRLKLNYRVLFLIPIAFIPPNSLFVQKVDASNSFTEQVKLSPSRYILDYWGDWILKAKDRQYRKLTAGKDFSVLIEFSTSSADLKLAFDNDLSTRWSTNGAQKGGESFKIKIAPKIAITKIALNLGAHTSDFPRGMKIEAIDVLGNTKVVFEKNNWLGPVKFTQSGFPYFGTQSNVEIIFQQPQQLVGLSITQLGRDAKFDWSIAELELYE